VYFRGAVNDLPTNVKEMLKFGAGGRQIDLYFVKKLFDPVFIVILATLCIVGITFTQIYWVRRAFI